MDTKWSVGAIKKNTEKNNWSENERAAERDCEPAAERKAKWINWNI